MKKNLKLFDCSDPNPVSQPFRRTGLKKAIQTFRIGSKLKKAS